MVVVRPYPVVVMLTSFDIGGTERQTVELVRRLDRERFRVHVACFHRRGALLEDLPPLELVARAEAKSGFMTLIRFTVEQMQARIIMRNAQFGQPVAPERLRQLLAGDCEPVPFDYPRVAGLR